VGLLIIPLLILLAIPPLASTAAGYFTQSLVIEYVTLALFAILAVCSYMLFIDRQGRALRRREVEILEAVREPADD
jgi:membrane protein implicated in regulation of membrane protease activity